MSMVCAVTVTAKRARADVRSVVAWWAFVLRHEARETWRALPGPWWVKALLLAVCAAIPGPQDELILLAVVAACRKRAARREVAP